MSYLRIDYDHFKSRLISAEPIHVGATETTNSGDRVTLPQTAPDDTNSIWVAPNGSDANPGTQASPKLTIVGAVAALVGPTKLNVQIFRNGFVGDLIFTETANITFPQNGTIQAELGEKATIEWDSADKQLSLYDGVMNGVIIDGSNFINTVAPVIANASAVSFQINNCNVITKNVDTIPAVDTSAASLTSLNIAANFIRSHVCVKIDQLPASYPTMIFDNNILCTNTIKRPTVQEIGIGLWIVQDNAANSFTVQINKCDIIGFETAVYNGQINTTIVGNRDFLNFNNCYLANCNYVLKASATATGRFLGMTMTDCLNKTLIKTTESVVDDTDKVTTDTDVTIDEVITGEIDVNTQELFAAPNEIFSKNNPRGLIKQQGGTPPDGAPDDVYFITSPLLALLNGSWGSFDTEPPIGRDFAKTEIIYWPPKDVTITHDPINPTSLFNVNGDFEKAQDALKKTFTFGFRNYANAKNAWKLAAIMNNAGPKRLFLTSQLDGTPISLFTDSTTIRFNGDGTATPLDFNGSMVVDHWKGYFITIHPVPGDIENDLDNSILNQILGNDSSNFFLGPAYEDGVIIERQFGIYFILVDSLPNPLSVTQEFYSRFLKGGQWRELPDEETAAFEYSDFNITFHEITDFVKFIQ